MKKEKHITVNLTETEHAQILEQAEHQDRTPSALCRLLILKALKDNKE